MAINKVIYDNTTLIDITDTTATAGDVLAGKYVYTASGEKAEGNIATKTSSDLTVSGATVTAPSGYYASSASATIPNGSVSATLEKSSVTNHQLYLNQYIVTTAGYVTSGSQSTNTIGVSAYELTSGTRTITSNTEPTQLYSGTENITSSTESYYYKALDIGTISEDGESFTVVWDGDTYNLNAINHGIGNESIRISSKADTGEPFYMKNEFGNYIYVYVLQSGSHTFSITRTGEGVTNYDSVIVNVSASPNLQAKTNINPTTSSQTVEADNGYDGLSSVQINAMPSGTAGTPTATKGTVSNHSVSVTPSVTNTTGYITGSTKTGTAVTVSASELDSGTKSITQNGTGIDVVGYATVDVAVSGGGGSSVQIGYTGVVDIPSATSSISFTGLSGEPTSFLVYYNADLSTPSGTPYKVACLVYDGTDIHGQTITNTSNAQVTYDGSSFSKSYNNGTLTLSSSGAYFQAGDYNIIYSYNGTAGNIQTADVQVGSGATSITFTGLDDEPLWWSCIFKSNFGTSSGYQRVIFTTDNDGSVGMAMDSSAHLGVYWTASYSNGSLTITSQGTNAGGYFHQPGYYQLTYVIGGDGSITAEPLSVTTNGTYTAPRGKAYTPVTVNVPQQGGATVATKTMTNSSATATSIEFTDLAGQPKAFFVRCTSNMARNSSNRYYYIADIRWDGSSTGGVAGNKFYMYNGTYSNQTTGYSYTYSSGTLTLSTTGSQSASPGSFFNGTYELVYIY